MPTDNAASPQAERASYASHPGVLAHLLGELGGTRGVSAEAARLFLLDPALAVRALEAIAHIQPGAQLADMRLETRIAALDPAILKSLVITAAAEQLAQPGFSLEGLETNWRKALATAHFSRALAERAAYPGTDEAWLAGLLCWLPRFARQTGGDTDAARDSSQTTLDRLSLDSFLPDVLRYINEPAQRLKDASPLVRLALAAYRQTMNYPAWIPALPHPDTLALAAPIDREAIREIYLAMGRAIDQLAAETGLKPAGEIARELSRMSRLELLAGRDKARLAAAVSTLADSLASQEGLGQALYLQVDPRSGALQGRALGDGPAPAIAIQPEGSTTAAAWALLTRSPVVVTLEAPADAAVLDLQLIRQAGAEGLAAIPIGADEPLGVLIVRGSRHALAQIAANQRHYARLGELAGRRAPPAAEDEAPSVTQREQLSGRVRRAAHEISNPLGIIKNYLAIMQAKLGGDAPVADELRIMHEELDRIVRIMRGLANDEAAPAQADEAVDVNALIDDLVKVTAPTWRDRDVRIETRLDPALPKLPRDRDKLKQIILNLLLNALEATPPGGTVRLQTGTLTDHRQQRLVEITVADSGSGIPAELAGRIFTPLESGKGDGHAGIGLSIVKALTLSLNGNITFRSDATGTLFQLSFPVS